MSVSYQPRIVDDELAVRLTATGAVAIEGPKACGKTATARQIAASEALLDTDINVVPIGALGP
jgi:MoxR-like ATPase